MKIMIVILCRSNADFQEQYWKKFIHSQGPLTLSPHLWRKRILIAIGSFSNQKVSSILTFSFYLMYSKAKIVKKKKPHILVQKHLIEICTRCTINIFSVEKICFCIYKFSNSSFQNTKIGVFCCIGILQLNWCYWKIASLRIFPI